MMLVKICGLKTPETLQAAAGADFAGFVFYPASPRALTKAQAQALMSLCPASLKKVGLFVNPADDLLDDILSSVTMDMIQLHGDETPERVRAIARQYDLPVIKALRLASTEDLDGAASFEEAADWLLFDARAGNSYGGTGTSFDWSILREFKSSRPWMLSGGLNAGNIHAALNVLSPAAVDISSGVEDKPGHKNPAKIREFIEKVRERR